MFFITCLIMLAVCGISMAAFYFVAEIYDNKIYSEAAEVLNLTSSTVDQELNKIEQFSFQIATDSRIQEYLAYIRENEENYEAYRLKERLYNRMLYFMQQERYISSMQIIDARGAPTTTYLYMIEDAGLDFESIAVRSGGSNVWLSGGDDSPMLIAVRQIRGMRHLNLAHYGVLVMWIDVEKLVNQFLDFSREKMFVITKDGVPVFSNRPELAQEDLGVIPDGRKGYRIASLGGESYLFAYMDSNFHPGLKYYNILSYATISRQTARLRDAMILFFAVLFILSLFISRKAANSITKPLVSLTEKMKQVQRGNFEITETIHREHPNMDETGHLHRNFRIMLEKINELFEENYKKQLIIQETEYKALQAQINPHFLYNTLDTINWMAKINKQDKIAEMVEALGHMLRSVISKKDPLIPLQDELKIVNDYVTIQKNRFDERLDFHLLVEPEMKDCLIPKLTIQPVVENAVQHGLEAITGVCRIEVAVRNVGDRAEIVVSDNGPGMDEKRLEELRRGEVRSKKTGIGLNNIEERIKMMFGEQYGIHMGSKPGQGTVVTLVVPVRKG